MADRRKITLDEKVEAIICAELECMDACDATGTGTRQRCAVVRDTIMAELRRRKMLPKEKARG